MKEYDICASSYNDHYVAPTSYDIIVKEEGAEHWTIFVSEIDSFDKAVMLKDALNASEKEKAHLNVNAS